MRTPELPGHGSSEASQKNGAHLGQAGSTVKHCLSPTVQKALTALMGRGDQEILYQIMDELDRSEDGRIEVALLHERLMQLVSMLHEGVHLDEKALLRMVEAFDVNHDGKIDKYVPALLPHYPIGYAAIARDCRLDPAAQSWYATGSNLSRLSCRSRNTLATKLRQHHI